MATSPLPPSLPLPPGYTPTLGPGSTPVPTDNSVPAGGGWYQGIPGSVGAGLKPAPTTPTYSPNPAPVGSLYDQLRNAAIASKLASQCAGIDDPCCIAQTTCGLTNPGACSALLFCRIRQTINNEVTHWLPLFLGILLVLLVLFGMFNTPQNQQRAKKVFKTGSEVAIA